MPACHAGGRGFEPLLGRHLSLTAVGHRAGVAQLAEQLICNQQVAGSSPFTGSTFSRVVCLRMDGFPSGQREQTVNLPSQTSMVRIHPHPPMVPPSAGMAELADALDSGSSVRKDMQVQVLFPAPKQRGDPKGSLLCFGGGVYPIFFRLLNAAWRNMRAALLGY